jgi:hypothetical protein
MIINMEIIFNILIGLTLFAGVAFVVSMIKLLTFVKPVEENKDEAQLP